jgi:hypothetical protein
MDFTINCNMLQCFKKTLKFPRKYLTKKLNGLKMDCAINSDKLDCLSTKTYLFVDTKQNILPVKKWILSSIAIGYIIF